MEIKEAIKFSETIKFRLSYLEEIQQKQIIELLKRGGKYEQMWRELEIKLIKGYFINHSIKLENCKELYKELKDFIEQKYFPKEK